MTGLLHSGDSALWVIQLLLLGGIIFDGANALETHI